MKKNILAKLWLMLVLFVAGMANASAENVISISGYDILAGQTKEMAISVNCAEPLTTLQLEIALPEGLTVVPDDGGDMFQKTETTIKHALSVKQKNDEQKYLILMYSSAMRPIPNGDIITFTVKASSTYAPTSLIGFNGVQASTTGAKPVEVDGIDEEGNTSVANENAKFVLSSDAVSLKVDETAQVSLNLYNKIPTTMMQARVILPEGLEIVKDESDPYASEQEKFFVPTTRTSNHTAVGLPVGENEYTLMIQPIDPENPKAFKGTEGAVVTFTVKATAEIEGKILVEKINCSDAAAHSIHVDALAIPVKAEIKLLGDVNLDGKVNIADYNAIILAIQNGEVGNADVNGDGKVNVADLNMEITLIQNQ